MYKSALCFFLLSWFSLSAAMDTQQQDLLFRLCDLPPEIVGVIVAFGASPCAVYSIENMMPACDGTNAAGMWCIPCTQHGIKMYSNDVFKKREITEITKQQKKKELNGKNKPKYFFRYQCWYKWGPLRFYDHAQNVEGKYFLRPLCSNVRLCLFDGANAKDRVIFSRSSVSKSYICTWQFSAQYTPPMVIVLAEKYITSVMLHPEENRLMYSVCNVEMIKSKVFYMTETGEKEREEERFHLVPDTGELYVADIVGDALEHKKSSSQLQPVCKKTLCLGKDTYLYLTHTGKLMRVGLNEKDELTCAPIALTKYDANDRKTVLSDSVVKDIAIDYSCKTANGRYSRIAYITENRELFVVDLQLFRKPIAMFHSLVPESKKEWMEGDKKMSGVRDWARLFYDEGTLGAVWAKTSFEGEARTCHSLMTWPDNLGLLYLKTVLAQKQRQSSPAASSGFAT